jgi:hypothetical protein
MAKMRNFYCLLIAIGLLTTASACNNNKIKGNSIERGAVKNPSFTVRTILSANSQTLGTGEFYISGGSEMTVACSNCGGLNLAFAEVVPTSATAGKSYLAKFSYPFVDRTYVCKAKLKVTYVKEQTTKDFVFGIFFCPEDPNTHSRICDKSGAIERCGF